MRKYLLAAVIAGSFATPAFAQDRGPFEGFRVDGLVGYDRAEVDEGNTEGITYGAAVGYDLQRGGAVFGVEGEVSDSSADECFTAVVVATDELCAAAGRDFYVGGRVGAVVSPRVLVYGKAGYTNARLRFDYEDGTAATAPDFSVGENLDGLRVGGGLEFAVSRNAYLRTEYRYSNYEQGFERHQVVGGFGFRF